MAFAGYLIQQGECPHANACLTCVHFGTSSKYLAVLKEQLVQTDRILEAADAQGWMSRVRRR